MTVTKLKTVPTVTLRQQRETMTAADMAAHYGVSIATIYVHLRRRGIRGGVHANYSLDMSKVRRIRQQAADIIRRRDRLNITAIAREYGVRPSTIADVIERRSWQWVE